VLDASLEHEMLVISQDVCLAALYVSTKMHDTLKKPRELLAMAYTIRFPEIAAKSKNPTGEVDLELMEPAVRPPRVIW
jgi:CTD kinase subunit beta